jgi:hypothetical protein
MTLMDHGTTSGSGSGSGMQPGDDAQELERLWTWGLHEDELLVNRMSVSLLAQSILLVAAVGILAVSSPDAAEKAVEIVLDLAGITITISLWHVFTLHADHIRLLSKVQRDRERRGNVYAHVHELMAESRKNNWMQKNIFGEKRGTKWIMANVISAAILAIWLALLGAAIASAAT